MEKESIRNIWVFGIGGVGGVTAARLGKAIEAGAGEHPEAAGRRTLSLVARGRHLEAIRSQGLQLQQPDGSRISIMPDSASDRAAELPDPDLVFLCVKGYSLSEAATEMAGRVSPETVIVPLLNGADIHERLRTGLARPDAGLPVILPACIYVSARIESPGVIRHVGGAGMVHLGPDPMHPDYDPAELLALMDAAGIPYRWYDNPAPAIWTKYVFIAAFGLVTAASGASFGPLLADPDLSGRVRGVIREISRIAGAKGIPLPPDVEEQAFTTARAFPPETRTSFQADVESGSGRTETDLFGGTILRLGRELGIDTPVTAELQATLSKRGA